MITIMSRRHAISRIFIIVALFPSCRALNTTTAVNKSTAMPTTVKVTTPTTTVTIQPTTEEDVATTEASTDDDDDDDDDDDVTGETTDEPYDLSKHDKVRTRDETKRTITVEDEGEAPRVISDKYNLKDVLDQKGLDKPIVHDKTIHLDITKTGKEQLYRERVSGLNVGHNATHGPAHSPPTMEPPGVTDDATVGDHHDDSPTRTTEQLSSTERTSMTTPRTTTDNPDKTAVPLLPNGQCPTVTTCNCNCNCPNGNSHYYQTDPVVGSPPLPPYSKPSPTLGPHGGGEWPFTQYPSWWTNEQRRRRNAEGNNAPRHKRLDDVELPFE